MKEKELIRKIEQWAEDRNLILGSTPQKQFIKLMEEFGELCGGISRNNHEIIKDAIGDCFVVLTIINKQVGNKSEKMDVFTFGDYEERFAEHILNLYEYADLGFESPLSVVSSLQCIAKKNELIFRDCIQHAYEQIKDRKGKMIDGVFVKEEDLNKEQV